MRTLFAFVLYVALAGGQLFAATLDFDSLPSGVTKKPLVFPDVVISESSGGSLFVYGTGDFGMPAGGGVCGLQSDFACTGDVSLLFIGPISNLKFRGFDASVSDKARITAYSDDFVLSVVLVSGTSDGDVEIDFSGISGITKVEIEDRSSTRSRGIAYGDFIFDRDPPTNPGPPKPPLKFVVFDTFDRGANVASLDLAEVIIRETSGGKIFVYRTDDFDIPQNGGLCAFKANVTCMGNLLLEFKVPVFDLTFSGFFAKITDSSIVSLFDGDLLLYTGQYFGNSAGTIRFDFSKLGKLTKIMIEDASDPLSKGIAYGDFRYRLYTKPEEPTPIPLPATAFLMMAGLGSLLFMRIGAKRPASVA